MESVRFKTFLLFATFYRFLFAAVSENLKAILTVIFQKLSARLFSARQIPETPHLWMSVKSPIWSQNFQKKKKKFDYKYSQLILLMKPFFFLLI